MKFITGLAIAFLLGFVPSDSGDHVGEPFPKTTLKTLDGGTVDTADFFNEGKITVVSFWATWCVPCQKELDNISKYYGEWQEDYDVQLVAISIDSERILPKVAGIVESKGWDYHVFSDAKQELMKSLEFQTIPQTFLLDSDGNIVYSHNGYSDGDELILEEHIAEVAGK